MRLIFRGVWLIPASFLLVFAAQAQPQDPPPTAADERTSLTPSMSLAELEDFIGGRTLLTVDLQDVPLADVASALSRATGLQIKPPPPPRQTQFQGALVTEDENSILVKSYSLSAQNQPLWEAIYEHSRAIRAANDAKKRAEEKTAGQTINWNDFTLEKSGESWLLQENRGMPAGRISKSWPFLLMGTQLTRTQSAVLSDDGLQVPAKPFDFKPFPLAPTPKFGKTEVPKPEPAEIELPIEKRWVDGLIFQINAFVDPKVEARHLTTEVLEATDELGNDLRAPFDRNANRNYSGNYYGGSTPISLRLQSQPKMGKTLVKLRGNVRFIVTTRVQHWETTALQTPVDGNIWRNGGEFQTQFSGLKKDAQGNWTVTLKAQSRGDHLRRLWNTRQELQNFIYDGWTLNLTDAKGQKFYPSGGGRRASLSTGNAQQNAPLSPDRSPLPPDTSNWKYDTEQTFNFGPPQNFGFNATKVEMGQPVKLSIDYPAEQREIVVPFEFDNLPLPPS